MFTRLTFSFQLVKKTQKKMKSPTEGKSRKKSLVNIKVDKFVNEFVTLEKNFTPKRLKFKDLELIRFIQSRNENYKDENEGTLLKRISRRRKANNLKLISLEDQAMQYKNENDELEVKIQEYDDTNDLNSHLEMEYFENDQEFTQNCKDYEKKVSNEKEREGFSTFCVVL